MSKKTRKKPEKNLSEDMFKLHLNKQYIVLESNLFYLIVSGQF